MTNGNGSKYPPDPEKTGKSGLSMAEMYLEIANVIFVTLDGDQRVTLINNKGCEILGFEKEEILGKIWCDHFIFPEEREKIRGVFREILCGKIKDFEHNKNQIMTRTGERRSISWYNTLLFDPDGKISGILTTGEDVTEHDEAERKLKEYSDRLALATGSAGIGIWDIDLATGEVTWDRKQYELYGLDPGIARAIPETWENLIHPEDKDAAEEKLADALSGKTPSYRNQFRIILPDNQIRYLEASAKVHFDESGKAVRVTGVNWDSTEVHELIETNNRLQREFYQSQKLESIGRLAGGIAHDFNNLLVPIIGYAEMGLSLVPEGTVLHESFQEIEKAGSRGADLTRQILAFSRRQVLETKPVRLNSVLQDFKKMIGVLLGENIALVLEPDPDLPSILADRNQIEQILLNLCINARDAIKENGRLVLKTQTRRLTAPEIFYKFSIPPGTYAILSVEDSGAGMDETVIDHIFEPFYTTKPRERGTGLGLSTVFGIVKQHGGYIVAESVLKKGTVFRLYFPADETSREPATPDPLSAAGKPVKQRSGTETLLVVEDDESVRRLILQTLKPHGYRILEAADAESALLKYKSFKDPIHLLLTDVMLPGMNGWELSRHIKKENRNMKTTFISGYQDSIVPVDELKPKKEIFLDKPFLPARLLETIRGLLDS